MPTEPSLIVIWLHTDLFVQTWIFFPLLFIFFVLFTSVDNDCSCSSGPEGKQRCKIGQLISHLRATSSSRRPTKFAHAHAHAHAHTHAHTHEQAVDKLCDASMFCLMELYSEWGKGRSIEENTHPFRHPRKHADTNTKEVNRLRDTSDILFTWEWRILVLPSPPMQ